MFQKPFRIKSNIQMKNSERKGFKNFVLKEYPHIAEDTWDFIFGNKEIINVAKAITHQNDIVSIYVVKKRPMFFMVNNNLFPTVYTMWHLPNILTCLTAQSPVLDFLTTGADLMLPGVIVPDNVDGPEKYGNIEEGSCVSVNLRHNKAPIAVGTALMSSLSMYKAVNRRGKCVKVLHTFGDKLWLFEGCTTLPIPEMGSPDWLKESGNARIFADTDDSELQSSDPLPSPIEINNLRINESSTIQVDDISEFANDDKLCVDVLTEINCDNEIDENKQNVADMDILFKYCVVKVIKQSGKKIILPILTSNFYKLMMQVCPLNKNLDIKKSSYKKFSKFMKEISKAGILVITEKPKGVENVTSVDFNHTDIKSFVLDKGDFFHNEEAEGAKGPVVSEAFQITALVLPIFKEAGLSKGDPVLPEDFRKHVTSYVKNHELIDRNNKGYVQLNAELAKICKCDGPLTWEQLMQKFSLTMGKCFKIKSTTGNEVKGKGKIESIVISVATRTGNKKVTLVDNLELYGIQVGEFGKECQHGVAASTSVSKPPGCKYNQLLVQGNQVLFVGNLLMDKYKIPKKYIRGLELAPKKR